MSIRICPKCRCRYDYEIYGNKCPYCPPSGMKKQYEIPSLYGPPPIRETERAYYEYESVLYGPPPLYGPPMPPKDTSASDESQQKKRKSYWKYIIFVACAILLGMAYQCGSHSLLYGPPPIDENQHNIDKISKPLK